MSQVNKVVCDIEGCEEEVKPEVGAPVVSMIMGMGNKPLDFCSTACAMKYLSETSLKVECVKVKEEYANHKAAEEAVSATGLDPKAVAGMKVLS